VILQVEGIIQEGTDLCLNGFFGIEVIPKNNEVNKFNFEGKIKSLKMRIVALIMLPCNIILDLRTDIRIVEWLYKYSETGSMRRELDDGLIKFC